ncbi:MAG: thioesterase family protein, partial [Myxococcales bacterium]|nr:thioesterase family protein [Myxococcales bacterium]
MEHTPFSIVSAWQPGLGGGRITADWAQGRAAFGGLLATGALRAARTQVAPDRQLRSALVDFVGPAAPGPVDVEVQVLREGRALTRVEVRLSQGDAVCAVVLASYGADRPTLLPWPGEAAPAVPPATERPSMPFLKGVTPDFTQHFDYRWTVDSYPFTGRERGHVQGWVQVRGDEAPVTAETLPALLDAWPPPIWSRAKRPFPGSSVTW